VTIEAYLYDRRFFFAFFLTPSGGTINVLVLEISPYDFLLNERKKERFSDCTTRFLVDSAACVRQEGPWLTVVAARPGERVIPADLTMAALWITVNVSVYHQNSARPDLWTEDASQEVGGGGCRGTRIV